MRQVEVIKPISWVEISASALKKNIKAFRKRVGPSVKIAPCIKANAYGHGLLTTAKILRQSGVDWFNVNALFEAVALREAGYRIPIYILGYTPLAELPLVVSGGFRQVVYTKESVEAIGKAAKKLKKKAKIHIKVETGVNRQGVLEENLEDFIDHIHRYPEIVLEGISMHFANIEDTVNSKYAMQQLANFRRVILKAEHFHGRAIPVKHCANSASTILYPETHFDLVRPGIAVYGLWPSPETRRVAEKLEIPFELEPVLTWKTRVAQVKEIPKGSFVGYGCTFETRRRTRLAIIPCGYYDGYDRHLSNTSSVLIHGQRAPLRGRVCMNITMADVTDIPDVAVEDEVVLVGRQRVGRGGGSGSVRGGGNVGGGDFAEISAEEMGGWIGTINYEVTTRINENIPRIAVA